MFTKTPSLRVVAVAFLRLNLMMSLTRKGAGFSAFTRVRLLGRASSFSSTTQGALRRTVDTGNSSTTSSSEPVSPSLDRRPYFSVYYNDVYEVQLPPNHRFPMEKYRQVREIVQKYVQTPKPLQDDDDDSESDSPLTRQVRCDLTVSPLATVDELTTTHCPNYVQRFLTGAMTEQENRNVGFPWSQQGVQRALSSVGGTLAAACDVCRQWGEQQRQQQQQQEYAGTMMVAAPWGAHVAGGTHHAFYDFGEGFSVFSDIAVAANVVLERFPDLIRRILIIDLDVHQGNGNAVLFQQQPAVFTFSMQCQANFFSEKQTSDLDIDLPVGCTDSTYLVTLKHWLGRLKTEQTQGRLPFDLIFFQAGVDILEHDRLGRMDITAKGLEQRNQLVYKFARDCNVPLVITMGGGYPRRKDDWTPILEAHAGVYIGAHQFLEQHQSKNK
jgi:acetoin utilization deacetylase AcuC-like enzyme